MRRRSLVLAGVAKASPAASSTAPPTSRPSTYAPARRRRGTSAGAAAGSTTPSASSPGSFMREAAPWPGSDRGDFDLTARPAVRILTRHVRASSGCDLAIGVADDGRRRRAVVPPPVWSASCFSAAGENSALSIRSRRRRRPRGRRGAASSSVVRFAWFAPSVRTTTTDPRRARPSSATEASRSRRRAQCRFGCRASRLKRAVGVDRRRRETGDLGRLAAERRDHDMIARRLRAPGTTARPFGGRERGLSSSCERSISRAMLLPRPRLTVWRPGTRSTVLANARADLEGVSVTTLNCSVGMVRRVGLRQPYLRLRRRAMVAAKIATAMRTARLTGGSPYAAAELDLSVPPSGSKNVGGKATPCAAIFSRNVGFKPVQPAGGGAACPAARSPAPRQAAWR